MAFRSTVPQERPEYDLSNDLHEEVAADVVTESGAAGTTVSVVASLSIAANTEPSFRGAIRGMTDYGTPVSGNRTPSRDRTAIAALRLNWSGLGRWISDQIRQQEIDEGSQFAASQRGVLSNLRY